jgi:hypothetical protein
MDSSRVASTASSSARIPNFGANLDTVVGLYLFPPEHALALSVDEKSQNQVLVQPSPV